MPMPPSVRPDLAPLPAPALDGALGLPHLRVLEVRGEDAASFLHGQLTQDAQHLAAPQLRLAGYCSPKGRLLATFWMWRPEADRILLLASADIAAATARRLAMFVLRARARVTVLPDAVAITGLAGASAPGRVAALAPGGQGLEVRQFVAAQEGWVLRLPDAAGLPRYVGVGLAPQALAPGLTGLSLPDWHWLDVASGVAWVCGPVVEQFVPQMINLELVGGVDFRKGCFPGQEIVARSQYRGTLKRRAFLVHGEAAMQPGQEVYAADDPDQPCGMIVLAAPRPASAGPGWDALAELKIAAARGGELRLGSATGATLALVALPYPVPLDSNEWPADAGPGGKA